LTPPVENFPQVSRSIRVSADSAAEAVAAAGMAGEPTDAQLVRRVQKGDKGAFDLLVLKYQHKIVNLVMRYVRDPDQALDISQEAFLKAYRALPRFRGDSAFYTWLYRIAVNTAKNYLAAQRRRPLDVELDLQDPEQFDLHAKLKEVDTPEGVVLSRELHETVERAIDSLPDDLRTAIVLRELDGMSYEEIAQTMDCPVGTVRSRIFRARDAIGKKIASLAD
jgi:RNA polymerase sigma-70 factor (ECF subfamily)